MRSRVPLHEVPAGKTLNSNPKSTAPPYIITRVWAERVWCAQFRTMPDLTFDSITPVIILLQSNLFSCGLPHLMGGTSVHFSLVGFGNSFRHPGAPSIPTHQLRPEG